jgi:epsin
VRQKAKDITNLLQDEDRLREERRSRASMRDRMIRGVGGSFDGNDNEPEDENARRRDRNLASKRAGAGRDESDELKKAIEESKKSLAQEMRKKEEDELKQALQMSEQEELKRQKDVENSNAQSLFDDQSM